MIFLLTYVILCLGDVFFAFMYPDVPFWQLLTVHLLESTIILVPMNYVMYIHRKTFKQDRGETHIEDGVREIKKRTHSSNSMRFNF